MAKAILIKADDWEGLFVDGILIEEGHTLNQGMSRVKYFLELSKDFDFDLEEMEEVWIDEEDEDNLYRIGCFPSQLTDLKGSY